MASRIALLLVVAFLPACFAQTNLDRKREIQLHAARARQALDDKKPDLAVREFEAILALNPKDVDARANIGVVAFVQGRCAEASQHFRQALQMQPSQWKVQAMLGLCEKSLGQPENARTLLQKSFPHLEEPKLRTRAGMALVELAYQSADLGKALSMLNVLQKQDPASPDVLYAVYRIHSDLATQARDRIALVAPDSARMHQVLAQHLVNEGDAKGAVTEYRQALAIDPRLAGAHFELGEAILQDSATDEARQSAQKEFEAALELNPNDGKSECRLGALAAWRGDPEAAFRHYTRAAEKNPLETEAQIGVAKVLVDLGRQEDALAHLMNAVRLDPLNATAHYRLAQLYRQLGRVAEADRENQAFKQLREAKDRIRSAYTPAFKSRTASQVLDPDVPR